MDIPENSTETGVTATPRPTPRVDSPIQSLNTLKKMLLENRCIDAVAYANQLLTEEEELIERSNEIEKKLVDTRKWILIIGFSTVVLLTLIVFAIMKSNRNKEGGKFCAKLFILMLATLLYLAAIVPQIRFFDLAKSQATDGVMTSFLGLAMLAVVLNLIARGTSLKTAYESWKPGNFDYIIVLISMCGLIIPFGLHVYMIWQISKYNDDKTATTIASKRLAHWAWWAITILFTTMFVSMYIFGVTQGYRHNKSKMSPPVLVRLLQSIGVSCTKIYAQD